jgi:hypothetical protein
VLVLVAMEWWPRPFPQSNLPPVPEFYQRIAHDPDHYGVFDWPLMPPNYRYSYVPASAVYQVQQMTHGKGIAAGYLSRTYAQHPVFPGIMREVDEPVLEHVFVNGYPAFINTHNDMLAKLAAQNYRYFVWHKHIYRSQASQTFVEATFRDQPPLVDDDLVRVYEVASALAEEEPSITLKKNWLRPEDEWRWAASPARLEIDAPHSQPALLQITPATMYDPQSETGFGARGMLDIGGSSIATTTVEIVAGHTATVPLVLPEGTEHITLALQAGNFEPEEMGLSDSRLLSFAVSSFNLQTFSAYNLPEDITINGQPQNSDADVEELPIFAVYGPDWFGIDPAVQGRWATSPARFFIYSSRTQQAQLYLLPVALNLPDTARGGANPVTLHLVSAERAETYLMQPNQPIQAHLAIQAGWNTVSLRCMVGEQLCDFALADVDIRMQ